MYALIKEITLLEMNLIRYQKVSRYEKERPIMQITSVSIQVHQGEPIVMLEVSAGGEIYVINGLKLSAGWNVQARAKTEHGSICASAENEAVTEAVVKWFSEHKGERVSVHWKPHDDERATTASRLIAKIQRL